MTSPVSSGVTGSPGIPGPSAGAETVLVPRRPVLAREFAVAALTSGGRPGLRGTIPGTVLRMPMVKIDRDNLFAYQKLCGFTPSDALPPTYPHLLAFPLQAKLMAVPEFPLAMPGLIHLRNEIIQHDALVAHDEPDVMVFAEKLRAHPKGTAVDLVTRVDVRGAVAWESRSTYLARGSEGGKSAESTDRPGLPTALPSARWQLPGDLGRQYAAVSGDVNPIHLHPWTARLYGFRGAIAHGMWTYARTLAALGSQVRGRGSSQVWFRKPVALPSTVRLVREARNGVTVAAVLSAGKDARPHLVATWTAG